jgi:hypothetical protein
MRFWKGIKNLPKIISVTWLSQFEWLHYTQLDDYAFCDLCVSAKKKSRQEAHSSFTACSMLGYFYLAMQLHYFLLIRSFYRH